MFVAYQLCQFFQSNNYAHYLLSEKQNKENNELTGKIYSKVEESEKT